MTSWSLSDPTTRQQQNLNPKKAKKYSLVSKIQQVKMILSSGSVEKFIQMRSERSSVHNKSKLWKVYKFKLIGENLTLLLTHFKNLAKFLPV